MKNTLILLIMLTFTTFGWVQNEPREVKSLAIEFHDYEWYTNQFVLWEKELKRNKKDEMAWINLYAAARMARIVAGEMEDKQVWYKKEKEVIEKMSKSIKGTFAYYRVLAWYNAV